MAARIRRGAGQNGWDEKVRNRIRAAMLEKRLIAHALEGGVMTATQVRAAEVLLRKVLPDLQVTELKGEIEHTHVVRMPAPVQDLGEWKQLEDSNSVPIDAQNGVKSID